VREHAARLRQVVGANLLFGHWREAFG
jgi:hypothetical protein